MLKRIRLTIINRQIINKIKIQIAIKNNKKPSKFMTISHSVKVPVKKMIEKKVNKKKKIKNTAKILIKK